LIISELESRYYSCSMAQPPQNEFQKKGNKNFNGF
jgi:hypothetical protein